MFASANWTDSYVFGYQIFKIPPFHGVFGDQFIQSTLFGSVGKNHAINIISKVWEYDRIGYFVELDVVLDSFVKNASKNRQLPWLRKFTLPISLEL
jgi:hypothetical protein